MKEIIKIIRGNAAIDAAILTKDKSIEGVQKYFGCRLEEIAAIGDEVGDLSFLTKKGLGLVGAPANAQPKLFDTLKKQKNSYFPEGESFNGFLNFYKESIRREIKLIISDKDGVLKDGDKTFGHDFKKLALTIGVKQNPYVIILTGSSYQQNLPFMEEYGLNDQLKINPYIEKYPFLVLAENGAVHINILNGEIRNYVNEICPELLNILKTDFEMEVRNRLEKEVLPKCNLSWSNNYKDQKEKVYHVQDKLSMVTFNVPRTFLNGDNYRKSAESEIFRKRVVEVMQEVSERLSLPYEII
jgi:hydroxymethylpyrimidine pyrophosphatase-like HAD family hydrolase